MAFVAAMIVFAYTAPMPKKRHSRTSRIDVELRPVLKQIGKRQRSVHPEIWTRWSDIVGEDIAKRALPFAFFRKTLIIGVSTSAWMQELSYLKTRLLERLDEEVGLGVVEEIQYRLNPALRPSRPSSPASVEEQRPLPMVAVPPEVLRLIAQNPDDELRQSMETAVGRSLVPRQTFSVG